MKEELYYKQLVDRYTSKKASDEELLVFFELLKDGRLDSYLSDSFMSGIPDADAVSQISTYKKNQIGRWTKFAVAASLIGLISIAIAWFYQSKPKQVAETNTTNPLNQVFKTVSTPRGIQRKIILSDGSSIWLNAASSIRYPEKFPADKRIVELDGEAYFEVVHNDALPFIVKLNNNVSIKVTGTHFNVHAYNDEPFVTSLFEGAIIMQSNLDTVAIKPGQQANLLPSGKMELKNTDTLAILSWKNGLFRFNRTGLRDVMHQLEKWYDVEVVYQGKVPDKQFVGEFSRSSDISEILQVIELSGVHFKKEGKKIVVLP